MYYIIELDEKCWIAPWDGDPGRTVVENSAKKYLFKEPAERALGKARKYRPFKNARIVEIITSQYQPIIDHAKTENLRLLIEVYKDGFTVLYCDKHRKREFLKQIRFFKIKTRIKIITYGYDIQFPEVPTLKELDYIRGRIIKRFGKERVIRNYSNWTPQDLYNIVTVDFPEVENSVFIEIMKDTFFTKLEVLKLILTDGNIKAKVNRDKDTFIVYYGGEV